ncbi:MAG: ATP-dependent sacrificial sulfur transferase LarE [Peptococcaceae bacterium]|nr:ATP-dependent sacrificial sulfur transferase LarE [Peptococcaceae bacterium]
MKQPKVKSLFGVDISAKLAHLKTILTDMGSALLACSGGTDSMLLLDVAHEVLGERLAVATVRAPYMFDDEFREAEEQVCKRDLKHYTPILRWGDGPEALWQNSPDRCYLCKSYVFAQLQELRQDIGMAWLMDGTQKDDCPAQRPGFRALRELGVRSPLRESAMTKEDIRNLAQARGLAFWNKPSNSCLLTRLPYDTEVTEEILWRVGQAEKVVVACGITQVRARVQGNRVRIETDPCELETLVAQTATLVPQLKALGFSHVMLVQL